MSSTIKKQLKAKFDLQPKHRVVPAFKLGSVQYWEFDDQLNVPCARAFAAIDYYDELKMRCTKDFLIAHTEAMDAVINSKNIE